MRFAAPLTLCLALVSAWPAGAAEVRSPKEVYGTRPNNLAHVPEAWQTGNPVQLLVQFNLKYPPGSPEAEAFLKEYVRFEKSLPFKGQTAVFRVVSPARFQYAGRLTFANWREYRLYEESKAFRDWYYAVWKPAVTETDELFTILDAQATGE